jgi:hypothetical protein
MSWRWAGGAAACAALTSTAGTSAAQDSYNSPVAGVAVVYGARSGWGDSDAMVLGGAVFAGWRWTQWRSGLLERTLWWRPDPGVAIDTGGFVSWDVLSVWADSALSAAAFIRLEPAVRWVSSTSRWAVVPGSVLGVRAVGIEMGVGLSPEIGLGSYPDPSSRYGFGADWRLSLDLIEIARLCGRVRASSAPLPP